MRIAERIGPALERLRRERGLTQGEVERQAGLTPRSLTKYEKPRASYSWSSIEKILEALDASLLDLHRAITGESPIPPSAVPNAAPLDERASIQRYAVLALERLARGEPPSADTRAGHPGERVYGGTAPAQRESAGVADRDHGDDTRDR